MMKFLSAILLLSTAAMAQAVAEVECATAASDADCVTCLGEGCVHAVGECMSSCDFIADASCWDMQHYEDKTVEEVCAMKDMQDADAAICGEFNLIVSEWDDGKVISFHSFNFTAC